MKAFWLKPKKTPRRFDVPRENVELFWKLYDADGKSGKYALWTFIEEMFPETKDGHWRILSDTIFAPYIVEYFDE